MKIIFFLLTVAVVLTGCNPGSDTFGKEGPLGDGWWLIPVLFGTLLPILIARGGFKKAKEGGYQREYDDQTQPNTATGTRYDKNIKVWYVHGLVVMAVVLFLFVWAVTIIRIIRWD